MPSKIGIKLADGSFVPVIQKGSLYPKKIRLTTAYPAQRKLRVVLVEKMGRQCHYFASLSLDNLKLGKEGKSTIELQMFFDTEKNFRATLLDVDSGFRKELSIPYAVYIKNIPSFKLSKKNALLAKMQNVWFGVAISALIATPSWFFEKQFPLIGGPIIAIISGMLLALIWKNKTKAIAGLKFTSNELLQFIVILLGFGMDINTIFQTGKQSLPIIICTITISQLIAFLLYKLMQIPAAIATLIGIGSAVGGGSAVVFISPIISADNEDIAQTVSVIFLFNILSTLLFPTFAHAIGLSTSSGEPFALFAGTAINNISAAGAAATTWDNMWKLGSQTLDKTITVKLTRTLSVIPLVFGLVGLRTMFGKKDGQQKTISLRQTFPFFILYFIAASCITTVLIHRGLNIKVFAPLKEISKFFLIMSMAAIGLNSNLIVLIKTGLKPLVLGACCWIGTIVVTLIMQRGMGIW
ncbi:MAG: YeiH family protein [Treponema sp.]